ncbi:transcriptional regulator with XRE-family HTH domain [Moryella indoligenes]|uniref:Transcriptional regulator with XRE-family HTH domain n=1 Tax=Moryella indoligenes TaxID=371674 RepID=A0AAE3V9X1_9FIRM|nr:DUF5688 family protein [Moryella indoligenes]MDQ0152406.1 transcriptional regulator with XRE-family HTH domain [Moryella indoligenes]
MRSIGERLKEWRLAAGMKQDIAAMRMNMSRTTLSAIEAGKREVLAKEIPGFVSLYGKSPEELLEGINGKENSGIMTEDMEQFANRVTDELIDRLDERGINNISMAVHDVSHQEEEHTEVSIHERASGIQVNVNLSDMQEEVRNGGDFNDIVSRAADQIADRIGMAQKIDLSALDDYEQIKDRLIMEIVPTGGNKDTLEKAPHTEMEDLSVVYRIFLGENELGRNTVLLTDKMLEHYGVSPEQLRADAGESAPKLFQPVIKPISEVLGMPMESGAEDTLYVATVQGMNYGAGVLAYPGFLDDAAEKLGGDFFILPSSIHEVLLMRDDGGIKAQELQDIISSVNKSEVMPEERLSDHAYRYDTKAHAIELAERFEARKRENPEHTAEDGRESVLTKLQDKKSEAAVKQPARDTAVKVSRMRGGEAI